MTHLRKIDNDFTVSEVIEYERRFHETLEELSDDGNPNAEKVAYLGYMRCRREDPDLDFDFYLENTTVSQAQRDAFGSQAEESIDDMLHRDRAVKMARWCLATNFPPSEYKALTYIEQSAMIDVLLERQKAEQKAMARRGR